MAFGLFLNAFVTSSAMAGGWAMGVIGSGAHFSTKGTESDTGDSRNQEAEKDANVLYGSIFLEYTHGDDYAMTFGVSYSPFQSTLGSGTRSDTTTDAEEDSQDDGTYTAKAKVSSHATIYIEPTMMTSDSFGVYLKGGVARAMVDSLEKIAIGEDSSVYGNEAVNGLLYGIGVKGVYDNGIFFKLEGVGINYGTVRMSSETGNKNIIEAKPKQAAVRLAIGYRF